MTYKKIQREGVELWVPNGDICKRPRRGLGEKLGIGVLAALSAYGAGRASIDTIQALKPKDKPRYEIVLQYSGREENPYAVQIRQMERSGYQVVWSAAIDTNDYTGAPEEGRTMSPHPDLSSKLGRIGFEIEGEPRRPNPE